MSERSYDIIVYGSGTTCPVHSSSICYTIYELNDNDTVLSCRRDESEGVHKSLVHHDIVMLHFLPRTECSSANGMVKLQIVFVCFLSLASLAGASLGPRVDLFVAGKRYEITYPCYRQPLLIEGSGDHRTLLAFAEGRNVSSCAPPLGEIFDPPDFELTNQCGGWTFEKYRSADFPCPPRDSFSPFVSIYHRVSGCSTCK